jgi:uncharacterized protein YecE (DUF72 family)
VNNTFYAQPRPEVARTWAQRTPPGFEFSVKLFQKFTHPRMFRERVARGLPEDARGDQSVIETLAQPNAADLDEFRRGIEPLAAAGRLGALLAQFPPSFKDDAPSREYLERLLRAFGDYPVAVELRHKSWSDRLGDTLALLNAFKAAWVQIDEPKFKLSIRQNYLPNVTGFYYMRLHGRNVEKWWRHDKSEDRYDYLYSADELKEFTETADAARRLVKKLYLYANNHFSAKSVANAAMIKQQLGVPIEGEYPPEFAERYPELANVIRVRTSAESDLLARSEPQPRRRR